MHVHSITVNTSGGGGGGGGGEMDTLRTHLGPSLLSFVERLSSFGGYFQRYLIVLC